FAMAPLSEQERRDFLEICDDRYNRRSTILTSQLPVEKWHAQIGDPTVFRGTDIKRAPFSGQGPARDRLANYRLIAIGREDSEEDAAGECSQYHARSEWTWSPLGVP
ncbi:MAG TPA: ATP-binding protein, partial [Candidatus Sulfotelmatobacter sp.]|nr:ATP-binding protein [Candidatus Sulfotelmatobacter sp.]